MDVFDAVRDAMTEQRVPGVAVGVLQDGDERHEGFGVTSVENPLEVTHDTRFQIGSITKTFLGTVAMHLVDRGDLDLDRPVRAYLTELRLADAEATERATMRHLLTHTGGWVGDYFDDTGWGDDAAAVYVERMAELPQLTPVGELWSYNNAGFVLAGRVIEAVSGRRFEDVVQELVFDPLELTSSSFWPWEVMTHRFAVGHVGEEPHVARPWPVGRSAHAAGGIVSTTPDLIKYARLHLDPPAALLPMQEPQAAADRQGTGREWVGLTWYGEDDFGTIRHGGGTMGQLSLLVLRPQTGFAMAVLTNHSPNGLHVIDAALEAAELTLPEVEPVGGAPVAEYAGVYETPGERLHLSPEGDKLRIEIEPLGGFPAKDSPPEPAPPPATAFFFTPDRWQIEDGPYRGMRGHFIRAADGGIAWLRTGGRLLRRIG